MHADALAARLLLAPQPFDVVVGSNLFGDILPEVTAAITGAIAIATSANLNPAGTYPSLFEPIHGSAPDIAPPARGSSPRSKQPSNRARKPEISAVRLRPIR